MFYLAAKLVGNAAIFSDSTGRVGPGLFAEIPNGDPPMRHAGLFDPAATRSSCGVGALVELKRSASHDLVEDAFQVLVNLDHRGARGARDYHFGHDRMSPFLSAAPPGVRLMLQCNNTV